MPEENEPNFYNLYQAVGRIEGEVKSTNQRLDKINGRLDSHSKQIDDVQKITNQIIGKASILGAIAGFVGAFILTLLGIFKK